MSDSGRKSEPPPGAIADAPVPKENATEEPAASETVANVQEETTDHPLAATVPVVTDPTEGPSANATLINPVIAAQVSPVNFCMLHL